MEQHRTGQVGHDYHGDRPGPHQVLVTQRREDRRRSNSYCPRHRLGGSAGDAAPRVRMGAVSLLRVAFGTGGDGVAPTFPRVDKNAARALRQAPVG